MSTSFVTVIRASGNNTGIEVPAEVLAELGAGKRPRVRVRIGEYEFGTTIGAMSGLSLISLSKARREASGLQPGQQITVDLELDDAPPAIEIPESLAAALEDAGLRERYSTLAPSRRKEHARLVTEAKSEETKQRRVAKIVAELQ